MMLMLTFNSEVCVMRLFGNLTMTVTDWLLAAEINTMG